MGKKLLMCAPGKLGASTYGLCSTIVLILRMKEMKRRPLIRKEVNWLETTQVYVFKEFLMFN